MQIYRERETGKRYKTAAINLKLVGKFLDDTASKLKKDSNTLEKLMLVVRDGYKKGPDERLTHFLAPKNVALLMFNPNPHVYFHGAKIEVALYTRDNNVIEEHVHEGPLDKQVKECIEFVLSTAHKERSISSLMYPQGALREAIVNAVYHRGYEPEYNDPIKISIRPECLEITSYPGPHPSLKMEDFAKGRSIPLVQARNRRIGEFLKDLRLAEARGTGVSTIFKTMENFQNPDPKFRFDDTYFQVTLPAHPKFQSAVLLEEVEELVAKGNKYEASKLLTDAFDKDPSIVNQTLMQRLILLHDGRSNHPAVKKYKAHISFTTKKRCSLLEKLKKWLSRNPKGDIPGGVHLIKELCKAKADAKDLSAVSEFAYKLYTTLSDIRKPILSLNQDAHQLLEAYGRDILLSDSTVAYDFACVKYNIYTIINKADQRRSRRKNSSRRVLKYLTDAREILEHAIVMVSSGEQNPSHLAELHLQLGLTLVELHRAGKATQSDYKEHYEKARKHDPKIKINRFMDP